MLEIGDRHLTTVEQVDHPARGRDDDLDAMLNLREAFDPGHHCNPEKIIPTTRFCVESNPKARGDEQVPLG